MSNRNFIIFTLSITFLLQTKLQETKSSSLFKLKREACNDEVQIRDCKEDDGTEKILTFYRIKSNQLIANLQTDCKFDSIRYKWSIYDVNHENPIIDYETNNVFVINPFSLKNNIYAVVLTPILTRNGAKVDVLPNTCGFKMEALDPIPVIDGGSERTVEANRKFVIDGSKSINRDVPSKAPGKLTYLWKCKVLTGQNSGFCAKEYKGSTLEVPPKHATANSKFLFTLNVKNQDSTTWISSEQTVTVLKDVVVLKIMCEKNCPPATAATDTKKLTFLRVKCLENCREDDEFEWSVQESFDYDTKTQFGRNTSKFVIKESALESGKKYIISVKVKKRKGGASYVLTAQTPIKIHSCEVKPLEGVALETKFSVSCNYTGVGYTFEIFTIKNEDSIVLTKSYKIDELSMMLSPDSRFYIKITDINGFQDTYYLAVTVKPSSKDVETFLESLQTVVSQWNTDEAIQTINGITDLIKNKPVADQEKIKHELVLSLQNLTLKSEDDARHIAAITTKVVNNPQAESDPYQGEIATEICKKSSDILLTYLKQEYHPTALTSNVMDTARTLTKCGETDIKQNLKILEPDPLDFQITTPFPVLEVPVIMEDYPDYETDTSVADKKKKYQSISNNIVGICENNLKMLGLTVVEGEETVVASSTDSAVEITRLVGKDFMEATIEIQSTLFTLSRDFEETLEAVDVMMCSWKRDPFWWNPARRVVVTNVVLVKVMTKKEIKEFSKPNRIDFNVFRNQKVKVHEITNKTVLRIDVKRGESFVVQFHKIDSSTSFYALVTNSRKPEPEEVKESGTFITYSENVLTQVEKNNFHSWYYLTVLPETETKNFTFWVSVFTKSCYTWNSTQNAWTFGCEGTPDQDQETIKCSCKHLSILSGVIYNNSIKVDEILTEPEFEMVVINSFVVFISTATTFGIYCLVITMKRRVTLRSVFLPADISIASRYVYLVAIRTGKKPSSGTSSNICLQVFGDANESEGHVLNFPDPQQRILQRGTTDWFIIPTLYHLGNVTKVALWSDHSGRHPRWFCLDVTVYDLQCEKKWYFNVNKWFDLPSQVYACVESSEKRSKEVFFRAWPKRTLQEGLSWVAKVTLLVSSTLMIFLVCLVFHGLPSLALRDGFSEYQNYGFDFKTVGIGGVSALVVFGYHLTLMWFFRRAKYMQLFWFLLFFNVTVALTVLVVFGFWIPIMDAYFWLTSAIIGVVVYVFILENLLDFSLSLFMDMTPRWDQKLQKLLEAIEEYRTHLFRQFGGDLLRPYFENLYQPLSAHDIKERRLRMESRRKLVALLEDTLMFVCYVTLLYSAIFANKNPMTIINHNQILDLLSGTYIRGEDYITVETISEFYSYINDTLIPTLHSNQWYGKYVVNDPGMMADFHNKFLGVARLRQRRVNFRPCKPSFMVPKNICRSESWSARDSYQHFGLDHNDFDRLNKVWNYTHSKVAGISVYVGKFGIYYGGGFVAPLGRTLYNSYANLFYLQNNSWLDEATSVIIIEFLCYNVNTNLFNAVKMVFERSATGFVRNHVELSTAQFLFLQDEKRVVQNVIFGSFVLVVFVFTGKFIVRLWNGKRFLALKDLWTLVDLLIVALSYTCFTVFVHRSQSVKVFLDKVENSKKNDFINYFHLLYEETIFTLIAAFLVFVATIRLWKVCRFGAIFRTMERTIIFSFVSVFHVLILHMVVVTAFALSGYLIFGTTLNNFRNISNSFTSLLFLTIGLADNFDLESLIDLDPTSGRLYYSVFMFLTMWFMTIYICVLMIYYYQAQTTCDTYQTIRNFITNEYSFYKTSFKMKMSRLRGGTKKPTITPKSDELRYADCMTLPSKNLEMMRCIVVRKLTKTMTKKKKIELMEKVIRSLFSQDKIDIFFKLEEKGYIKIIHDRRMELIAAAAEAIFNYDEVRNREKQKLMQERMVRKLGFIQQMLDASVRIVSNIEVE